MLSSCNFLMVFSLAFTSPFSALMMLSLLLASSSFHSPLPERALSTLSRVADSISAVRVSASVSVLWVNYVD